MSWSKWAGAKPIGADTLTRFLLARIAEDEAAARRAGDFQAYRTDNFRKYLRRPDGDTIDLTHVRDDHESDWWEHAIRHLPAGVLADCESKRELIRLAGAYSDDAGPIGFLARDTLHALATPYADHPDFREEWRP